MTPTHSPRFSCKALVLAALLGWTAIGNARAHAFLDHAEPVVGGTVRVAPMGVRLTFSEAVEGAFSSLQVFDAAGKEVDKKDVHVEPKNPRQLGVSLTGSLGAGTYRVTWRAVSVDTHVTQGEFTFRIEP